MLEFQNNVKDWAIECFGEYIAMNKPERCHRFLEESLELVQAAGISKQECLLLLDYVYSRPVGELPQEIGGTIVTLAALCTAYGYNLEELAGTELQSIRDKILKIREKRKNKPDFSPLP